MVFKKDHIPWNKGKTGVQEHSKETREKIRLAGIGRHPSEETRKKLSDAKKGKHQSEETKRKLSELNKGKNLSEETKRKIGKSNLGSHRSDETRRKMSESQKQAYINNPELRNIISKIHKGRIASKETREKMSRATKGRPSQMKGKRHTEESKRKISESHKKLHRHLSEEEKQKISIIHKGNKHCLGRKQTEEWKKQHSLFMKNYLLSNPEENEKYIKNLLNGIIQRPSKPQLRLFETIKKLYPDYYVDTEWKVKTLIGLRSIDVAIPELLLGFEWDEPYWHKDKEKDQRRHEAIEAEGWELTHYLNESDFPKA